MVKHQTRDAHDPRLTEDCERVLVTLLSGLGPWQKSIFLVGGLAPRYIVEARPPEVPAHAGTSDVDVVIDVGILADTEAYRSLEDNLERLGFSRVHGAGGKRINWRWQIMTDYGNTIVLEFLSWDPDRKVPAAWELPTKGNISALNIPFADIVFDLHEERKISAPLLNGEGVATVTVRHANLVSLVCLKALALKERGERKDAHDLIYCLEHNAGGIDGAIAAFEAALGGKHRAVLVECLAIVSAKFADDRFSEGYRKDGTTKAARFEFGDATSEDQRGAMLLRQRHINAIVERFLSALSKAAGV